MLKLVDKPDLGSGALRVWVRVPSPAPQKKEVTKGGLFLCKVRSSSAAAAADCSANSSSQQPPNWATHISLRNSVPERGFSCTESTRGTVEGLLWYATCFQRNSVLKIGFSGTGEIFGTKKPLLWYALRFQGPRCMTHPLLWYGRDVRVLREAAKRHRSTPPEHTSRAQNNTGEKQHRAANQPPGHKRAATIYSSR